MEILIVLIAIFAGYLVYNAVSKPKKAADKAVKIENPVISLSPEARNPYMAEKKASAPVVKAAKTSPAPKVAKSAPAKSPAKAQTPVLSSPEQVGLTAGVIWRYLDVNGVVSVAAMVKALDADEKTIQRSIGWLAQEGKIELETVDRAETIKLKG